MMPHRGGRGRQDLVSSTFLIAQPHDKDRAQVLRHHTRPEYLIPSVTDCYARRPGNEVRSAKNST